MIREFRQFLLRGNVVDLAVAVVIGAAFGGVVKAMVEDLMTPLIAAAGGTPDFSALKLPINGSAILYGDFLNAVIAFLIIAAVVFFLIVKPMNRALPTRAARRPDDAQVPRVPERSAHRGSPLRVLHQHADNVRRGLYSKL